MSWDEIIGHETQREMLRQAVSRGRLPHALLFLGPSGIGKRQVAQMLAKTLFCERRGEGQFDSCDTCPACKQVRAGSHPDLIEVAAPAGKSDVPIEAIVGSAAERGRAGLNHELSLRPMSAERRIAVLDDASRMTIEAANALLKTLEEPPSNALLILIADQEDRLLSTIRSRCQVLRFAPLTDEHLAQLLAIEHPDVSAEEVQHIAMFAGGSLTEAEQLLEPTLRNLRARLFKELASGRWSPVRMAEDVVAALEEIGKSATEQRAAGDWVLRFLADLFRLTTRVLSGEHDVQESSATGLTERLARNDEPEEACSAAIDRLSLAADQIKRNSPVPLIFESLMHDLKTILTPQRKPAGR